MVTSEGPQGWWEMRGVSRQAGAGQSFGKETASGWASHSTPLPSGCPPRRPFLLAVLFLVCFLLFHFQWVPALGRWQFQVFLQWRRGRASVTQRGRGLWAVLCVWRTWCPGATSPSFLTLRLWAHGVRPGIDSWNRFQGSGCGRPW